MRQLIKNACVITVNDGNAIHDPGFVLVENGRIAAVGPQSALAAGTFDQVIDAGGSLLAPGMINLHQHVFMNLLKGLAGGMRLEPWVQNLIVPTHMAMTDADLRASLRLGALEMLRTGTTTFLNHGGVHQTNAVEARESAAIFRGAGIRQVMAVSYQIPTPGMPDHPFGPAETGDYIRSLRNDHEDPADDLLRIALVIECNAHHTKAGRSSDELVLQGYALARELDLRASPHMSGGTLSMSMGFTMYKRATGRSDVEYLARLGVLDHRWLLAHGIHFSDQDMDTVAEAGAAVVYTPTSECMRGGGIGPWVSMLQRGILCCLGTDGPAVDYSMDMVEQMKAACLFQRLRHRDPTALMPATALRMATIWGARALGMDDIIGSIEVGKRADLVLFNRSRPTQLLIDDPVAALVMATNGSDAWLTMVNGVVVYREGRYAAGFDAEAVVAEAYERAAHLNKRTGFDARAVPDWRRPAALAGKERPIS